MSMFCFQCQETAKNHGCEIRGVCGKEESTAQLMDLLIYNLKGISYLAEQKIKNGGDISSAGKFICDSLFATITNANFDSSRITDLIKEAIALKKTLNGEAATAGAPEAATWFTSDSTVFIEKGKAVGVLSTANEDVRSLRELLIYGLKGIAAYAHHAFVLGYEDKDIYSFMIEGLASTLKELTVDGMVALVLKCGETAVKTMALLDRANTETYGNPELTKVNIGVRGNPGILISGHDLKDMEELLRQTEGTDRKSVV